MSITQLLDILPEERRKVLHHAGDGKVRFETRQDVTAVIDCAKMLSERVPDKDFTRVALIPKVVIDQSFIEGWFGDEDAWRKWANDPANRCYRTTKGTV